MWTQLRAQLIFPSKPNFCNLLNFQQQNPLKNQYLSHLSSENCEINSIKSDWLRAFHQHHQERPQIPMQFSVSILFSFHWENGSIINSFHTVAPNSPKPSQCTPTYLALSEDTKSVASTDVGWEISTWQTKQNNTNCLAS
jgi:hypothetical protein